MKKVVLMCLSFRFSRIEFVKPPFCLLKALKEVYNVDAEIVFDTVLHAFFFRESSEINEATKDNIKLTNITGSKKTKRLVLKNYFQYLRDNAKDIDLLIVFHGDINEVKVCNLYKSLNPNGKILNVMDFNVYCEKKKSIISSIKALVKFLLKPNYFLSYKKFINNCNAFTVETTEALNYLETHRWHNLKIPSQQLYLIPFGYTEENIFLDKSAECKENIIITVGRIGVAQKNSELILSALENVDLKNWKFYFVGPIEKSFQERVNSFYSRYPDKKKKIIIYGAVEDRKLLSELYGKSKLFVLSSVFESFGLVLLEASLFNNYVITTPVGCAKDLICQNVNGAIYENAAELSSILNNLILNGFDFNKMKNFNKEIGEKYKWENIIKNNIIFAELLK